MKKYSAIAIAAFLSGCTTISGVTPIGKDSYMIGATDRGGMRSHTEMRALGIRKANEFCQSKGKVMVISNVGSQGAQGWTPVESEVTFLCVDRNDPANQRPNLQKVPDTVVEIRK